MNLLPQYDTKLFSDIYETADDFVADYNEINLGGLTVNAEQEDYGLVPKLFYLLYAKFGNSPIANLDEHQFKYKLFSTIFMYGPAWESRLKIQDNVRALLVPNQETGKLDDLLQGSKAIHNHALNPETAPSTATLEEIKYINEQNTTNYKKSKMDAYGQLWSLISTDVTAEFLAKFNDCFKKFVKPANPLIYVTDEE